MLYNLYQEIQSRDFPAVQWLRLRALDAERTGLIPDQGTKIPHATQRSQKKKKRNILKKKL